MTTTVVLIIFLTFFSRPFFVAALVCDLPYGLGVEEYDKDGPPTQANVEAIMAQFTFKTKSPYNVVLFFCGPCEMGFVTAAVKAKGYSVQHLAWYKHDLNTAGDPGRWTQALEYAVFGVIGGQDARAGHVSMPRDPTHRHNIVIGPSLQKLSKYYTLAGDVVVNKHEKPEYVVQQMLGPFLKPGDNVIVAGSGAGGEVRGLLSLGVNVFGFEQDPRQWRALNGLLAFWEPPAPSFAAWDRRAVLLGAKYAKARNVTNITLGLDKGDFERRLECKSCEESLFEVDFDLCENKKCGMPTCTKCSMKGSKGRVFCKVCFPNFSSDAAPAAVDPAQGAGGEAS